MNDLLRYWAIVRRRRLLVIALPLVAALVSLALGIVAPPRYAVTIRMLVTRSEDRRFDTEDALAYDLPAIISGAPFAAEVAALLTRDGRPFMPEAVRVSLSASNDRRVVALTATAADPETPMLIANAATDLIIARGMALWGDPVATPERTGLNVVVLDRPAAAARVNGPGALVRDAALRAALGFFAAVGLAVVAEARRSSA
jgi:capsular polysaccharide biosynthesis protein